MSFEELELLAKSKMCVTEAEQRVEQVLERNTA